MTLYKTSRWLLAIVLGVSALAARTVSAEQLLVLDRLTSKIVRYSGGGGYLNTVVTDTTNLKLPAGLALSPDNSSLFVSSFDDGKVIKYDYDFSTATASNPSVFASGIVNPSAIQFTPDGGKILVSSLAGNGVSQFNLDGTSAGAPIYATDASLATYAGMDYGPTGKLYVAAFTDATFTGGAVVQLNNAGTALDAFVPTTPSLTGASGVMAEGSHVYVTGLFTGLLQRFDAMTGVVDPTFGVSGLAYPQALLQAPDDNGFLLGILGDANGGGKIARYGYDGSLLGTFATAGVNFSEATAFISLVPEPASLAMLPLAAMALGLISRRRSA